MTLNKTNHPGWLVDSQNSGVVINTNERELVAYRNQIEQAKALRDTKSQMAELEAKLLELQQLVLNSRKD